MNLKKTFVMIGTAAAIGLGAIATTGAAQAAPASPAVIGQVQVGQGVEQVGRKYHHRRYYKRHYRHYRPYRAYYKPRCYYKRVKVYSHYHHGYIIKKKRICRGW